LVDKQEDEMSTVVNFNLKKDNDENPFALGKRDYKKLLEEKIIEKKLNLHLDEKGTNGEIRENLQKRRTWMAEAIKPILAIKDTLVSTELLDVNLLYRRANIALNDLKSIVIKSIDYDESSLVKSGFKLEIDFCPKSPALNNQRDCYLVQLLGGKIERERLQKYYNLDTLMEFIINYCSEYIAEFLDR
jgi:hypothetical protein